MRALFPFSPEGGIINFQIRGNGGQNSFWAYGADNRRMLYRYIFGWTTKYYAVVDSYASTIGTCSGIRRALLNAKKRYMISGVIFRNKVL